MAERNPPVWMQSGTYNAADDRAVTGLLVDRTLSATGGLIGLQGGVVPGTDQLKASVVGSSMNLRIAPGTVVVPGRSSEVPGAYICHNQTATELTFPIVTGNPRWDLVVAEVEDVQAGHDENLWRLARVQGPVSASGPPAISSVIDLNARMAVPLYWVKVIPATLNGGANKLNAANVTDLRQYVSSMGGVHITESASPNPDHSPGRLVYSLGSDHLYISDGAKWQYFMTYQAWEKYFSAHRPAHSSGEPATLLPAGDMVWVENPIKNDNTDPNNRIASVAVTGMSSPTGKFKVYMSGFGRTKDVAGSALMSVRVLSGNTTVSAPSGGYKALGFYTKDWTQSSTTYMVNLEANTKYTFRLEFKKNDKKDNQVFFTNTYLLVDPVL